MHSQTELIWNCFVIHLLYTARVIKCLSVDSSVTKHSAGVVHRGKSGGRLSRPFYPSLSSIKVIAHL